MGESRDSFSAISTRCGCRARGYACGLLGSCARGHAHTGRSAHVCRDGYACAVSRAYLAFAGAALADRDESTHATTDFHGGPAPVALGCSDETRTYNRSDGGSHEHGTTHDPHRVSGRFRNGICEFVGCSFQPTLRALHHRFRQAGLHKAGDRGHPNFHGKRALEQEFSGG